jgi:hypothetical protein
VDDIDPKLEFEPKKYPITKLWPKFELSLNGLDPNVEHRIFVRIPPYYQKHDVEITEKEGVKNCIRTSQYGKQWLRCRSDRESHVKLEFKVKNQKKHNHETWVEERTDEIWQVYVTKRCDHTATHVLEAKVELVFPKLELVSPKDGEVLSGVLDFVAEQKVTNGDGDEKELFKYVVFEYRQAGVNAAWNQIGTAEYEDGRWILKDVNTWKTSNGLYQLRVRAVGENGWEFETNPVDVNVYNATVITPQDTEPPVIEGIGIEPSEPYVTQEVMLYLTAVDDSGIEGCEAELDTGQMLQAMPADDALDSTTEQMVFPAFVVDEARRYYVGLFCTDRAGNTASTSFEFDVVSKPPTQTCTPGWYCVDAFTLAYQTTNCDWQNHQTCTYGCSEEEKGAASCNSPPQITPEELPAPENLVGIAVEHGVALSWDIPAQAADVVEGFAVYKKEEGQSDFVKIATVSYPETMYVDSDVEQGRAYSYYITAVDWSGNESKPSAKLTITVEESKAVPPVQIITFYATPTKLTEGQSVSFNVKAVSTIDEDAKLTYIWDFGDGSPVIESDSPQAFHTYFIDEPNVLQKRFKVMVTVKDEFGNESKTGLEVVVTKAVLKIKMLEPLPDPSRPFSKGERFFIRVKVLDFSNNPVMNSRVEGKIAGRVVRFYEPKPGIFQSVSPVQSDPFFDSPATLLELQAYDRSTYNKSVSVVHPIFFAPAKLSAECKLQSNMPYEAYFIGDSNANFVCTVYNPDGTLNTSVAIEAELQGAQGIVPAAVEQLDGNYLIFAEYTFTEEDTLKPPVLRLRGRDNHGNLLDHNMNVQVLPQSPLFSLEVQAPKSGSIHGYGQLVDVNVRISSINMENLTNAVLKAGYGDTMQEMERVNEKTYLATVRLPDVGYGNTVVLRVTGTARMGGDTVHAFTTVQLTLTSKAVLKILAPQTKSTQEGATTLKVRINYENSTAYPTQSTISARLVVDGEPYDIVLKGKDGIYSARMPVALSVGDHSLLLELKEKNLNGNVKHDFTVLPVNFTESLLFKLLVVLMVVGVGALIIRRIFKQAEEKRKQQESYLEKKLKLEELMKRLKYEYYKRHITKEEYLRRLKKLQAEMDELEKERAMREKAQAAIELRRRIAEPVAEQEQLSKLERQVKSLMERYSEEEIVEMLTAKGVKKREIVAALNKIKRQAKKSYVCRICGRHFKNKFSLMAHLRSHKKKPIS